MRYYLFFFTLFIFSCGKEKIIQLPEINHSDITEINDVSAAYLFYDETKKDSVELNKSNLISTTNWLVNVDKRLTLNQAIPNIKSLQEKKSSSSHKNENSKNYFTCNDTGRKNLGFIEFTDVVYHMETAQDYFSKISDIPLISQLYIAFHANYQITISGYLSEQIQKKTDKTSFTKDLNYLIKDETTAIEVILILDENLFFQDYISFKSNLSKLDLKNVIISKDEFISN